MKATTTALVEIEVRGNPKRMQLVFLRGRERNEIRTWADGCVVLPRISPGEYVLTTQRAGQEVSKPRRVMFAPGRNLLVIPETD